MTKEFIEGMETATSDYKEMGAEFVKDIINLDPSSLVIDYDKGYYAKAKELLA